MRLELADEADRVLSAADICEPARGVCRTRKRCNDVIDADTECSRTVGIEGDLHLSWLLAGQVDLRYAGNSRKTRFDVLIDELLVAREVLVRVLRQYPYQQRRGRWSLLPATSENLRLDRIRRARRRLVEIVDDVEFGILNIRAHVEGQGNEAGATADERVEVGDAGRISQHIFLRLDDARLHFFRCSGAPEICNRNLRLLNRRQQLYRQGCDRQQSEQCYERNRNRDGRPVPGAQIR